MSTAFLLCFAIISRRKRRNHSAAQYKRQKIDFQNYIGNFINQTYENPPLDKIPKCRIHDMADVFVHYFRTLRGEKLERLQDMISNSDIESQIISASHEGVRGFRMRAVRTLSYLNSQRSLRAIFEHLSSDDKYVRLTAMRCLVRRKALIHAIILSFIEAFPRDHKLLASILADFGEEIVNPLEKLVRTSKNDVIIAACLETLFIMRRTETTLDLGVLMQNKSETVRSAALSLSAIATHSGKSDPLHLGLHDEAISVKIRATKMASNLKRTDLLPDLFKLASDTEMWVRYRALIAIWVTGRSGQQFVNLLSKTHPLAANVALEMKSGYV